MDDAVETYYLVRYESRKDAGGAVRALEAFVRSPAGRVRLEGGDRVVVWQHEADLYVSPGALSLAGYLEPDPATPRPPALCGPEMTPSRRYAGPAMTASGRVAATALPAGRVLLLGVL